MSLNIKNPEAHALAERVAKLTGETLTEAVTQALRERIERIEKGKGPDEGLYRRLRAIASECRALFKEPYLSAEHGDLLYDELGLPK